MTERIKAFVRGAALAVDLGGSSRGGVRRPSDRDALASDWKAVGRDLQSAMNSVSVFHAEAHATGKK